MPVFELKRSIKAHANVVWRVITDHEYFTEIAPDIVKVEKVSGEKLGMVQRLYHKSGKVWEEKCIDWKENSGYTMEIDTHGYPMPVSKMHRSCSMEEMKNNIVIRLKYNYTPKYGPYGILLNKIHILPILKMFTSRLMDNLVGKIYDAEWGFHVTASTIIKKKETGSVTITPEITVYEANKIRADNKIGCLMVLDNNKKIVGVLSERDIVNALAKYGNDVLEKKVTEIMTHKIISCKPDDDLQKLMTLMTERRIRHLPVIENDELVGIISIGDVVKARMDELEKESEALHNYIKDRRWRELSLQIGRRGATDEFDALDKATSGRI
jgi:CBS domain-containing protein